MSIIIARQGDPPVRLNRELIPDEDYLQQYLLEHPEALPLDQLREEARPLVLIREFPTEVGPIDAIGTDDESNLYLIETKLYKNPDKRRVLAQVLDYGASLWKTYSDPDDLIARIDALMQQRSGAALRSRLKAYFELEEDGVDGFVAGLKSIIANGAFHYVVLMDTVDDDLRNLISYVNHNSQFHILGVGLDFYRHEGMDILIPTLHGADDSKSLPGTDRPTPQQHDADSVFKEAARHLDPKEAEALRALHSWATIANARIGYGRGQKATFSPKFDSISPKSIFTAKANGRLRLNFGWLGDSDVASAFRDRFANALQREGFPIRPDYKDHDVVLRPDEWVPRIGALLKVLSETVEARAV